MEEDVVQDLLSDDELSSSFVGDTFSMYIKEVFKYKLLSIEENKELARRYQNGDLEAYDKLVKHNLRLVLNVAYKYRDKINHLQLLDVVQEGNLGLMRAIKDYNPEVGAFSTYAIWWIRQAIRRSISDKESEIRKPVNLQDLCNKYLQVIGKNKNILDEEIMSILDIGESTLKNIRYALSITSFSMNKKVEDDDESNEIGDFIASIKDDYSEVEQESANRSLFLIMKESFNELEYFILYYRFFNEPVWTLENISCLFGVSRERIRQIEAKILRKAKNIMENKDRINSINSKIRSREGKLYELLRLEPKDPNRIIKYLYIKDSLDLREKKLYYFMYFGMYKFSWKQIIFNMKISKEECESVLKSLNAKIEEKLLNKDKYESFKSSVIKNYGTKIFSIDINSDLKVIDYDELRSKYSNLSYEEIKQLFSDANIELTHSEEELLKRFYNVEDEILRINEQQLLQDINLTVFNLKSRDINVSKKKLYKIYLNNINEFSDEQKLFLECYFFGMRDKKEFITKYKGSSLYYRYYYLIDRLERMYFNIYHFLDYNLNKEDYIKVKEQYKDRLSNFRIEILDLFFGVNGKALSISEIAFLYNMDYIKMHDLISDAREAVIVLYTKRYNRLDIDKNIYIPYVKDLKYFFVPEMREVLSLFLIDELDYGEIALELGLTKYRVSNIITDGIRKIDNYRFGISEIVDISKEEFDKFILYYEDNIDEEERIVLRDKFIYHMENEVIASEYGIELEQVNRYARHFYILYYSYRTKDVFINIEDIVNEINRHTSVSVLNDREKHIASLYYGIKNKYNIEGKRYTTDEIKDMMKLTKNSFYNIFQNINLGIKGRKIGIRKPDYLYIERDKLDKILDDNHLPISDKERDIICYLFELKGYPYKKFDEMTSIFGDNKGSLVRRYQRAIVNIYKYLNKEIEGYLNYVVDIEPNLKYFSFSDRNIIEKYYKDGMSVSNLASLYNVSFDTMLVIVRRIKTNIFELLNNPNVKKFDFDYYLSVRYEEDLPFYGDLEKSILIFDLFYGMNDGLRKSVPEITKLLNLEHGYSAINKAANNLMLSVCKYKEGIRKFNMFTYDDVFKYYEKYKDTMGAHHRSFYLRYFKKEENSNRLSGITAGMSYTIINDLLKEYNDRYITLDMLNKQNVIILLKKYNNLSVTSKKTLMKMFDITSREFMNGKDINHVYRLLYNLDSLSLEKGRVLKKN